MELETVTVRGNVNQNDMKNIISTYSKSIEDLIYKVSVLENNIAELSAHVSELKEGDKNARS